jgi:hypothetical protein
MSDIPNPLPFKSDSREKVVRYASLYVLYMADLYMQSICVGTNDLKMFLKWVDDRFWNSFGELKKRANWDIILDDKGGKYDVKGKIKEMRFIEAFINLDSIAKYLKSIVRLYWDMPGTFEKNSLNEFTTKFIPRITKKIVNGKY